MHFAIYGRKSVYSDKSDSVSNQCRMCKEYIHFKFPGQDEEISEYTDEGLTGANTNRPMLQALLQDVKDGLVDALVVYQLDRLSRDVRDFANIYASLEEKRVMFISIKENIDTATPIGKAMMYVTMVFAQMERETIASRVVDNMTGLAKRGFWPIGTVPTGYVRQHITVAGKRHSTLAIDPDASAYIKSIYDTFLDREMTVQGMETYFRKNGIKTRNGCFFSQASIYRILTTPFYCVATPAVYDYWQALGCHMDADSPREMWDGTRGVMVYGRRGKNEDGTHPLKDKSEWLVCLGLHKGFIPAERWLAVQERFKQNTFDKTMKYDIPLLKGVLRCKCGGKMSVARKKKKNGVLSQYYCLKRQRQGPEVCDMKAITCSVLDDEVLNIFRQIEADPALIRQYVSKSEGNQDTPDVKPIQKKITACEARISRLTASLSEAENSSATKYIVAEIERQDLNLQALKREEELAKAARRRADVEQKSVEAKAQEIARLIQGLDEFSDKDRNAVINEVVESCVWNGETLFLRL